MADLSDVRVPAKCPLCERALSHTEACVTAIAIASRARLDAIRDEALLRRTREATVALGAAKQWQSVDERVRAILCSMAGLPPTKSVMPLDTFTESERQRINDVSTNLSWVLYSLRHAVKRGST